MKGKIAFIVLSILLAVTIGYSANISAYSYATSLQVQDGIEPLTAGVSSPHHVISGTLPVLDEDLLHTASVSVEQRLFEIAEEERLRREAEEWQEFVIAATNNYDSNQLYWFYRLVTLEDGDEYGQLLVANVVLNRAKKYGWTVRDVIFSAGQFDPVSCGAIYDCWPSESAIRAVDRALAGEDYSQGALFFVADYIDYSWFENHLTFLFQYGSHRFYR